MISVDDLSGNGTGPWRVMVNGFGICAFPSKASRDDPVAYAHELARVLALATGETYPGTSRTSSPGEDREAGTWQLVAALEAAIKPMLIRQGVMHDDADCPEDDTCECANVKAINDALSAVAVARAAREKRTT